MSMTMSKEELTVLQEKINEAFSDKAFAEKVLALDTAEAVRAALLEKDIDLGVEDINEIKDLLVKHFEGGEELSEEDLEDVSGGCAACIAIGIISTLITVVDIAVSLRW